MLSPEIHSSLTRGLEQWLWFLGQDALNGEINLLRRHGFERFKPLLTPGSSRYRRRWRGRRVELHSYCVGIYGASREGFIYIRARNRCFLYTGQRAPWPGDYPEHQLLPPETDAEQIRFHSVAAEFLEWLEAYEQWLDAHIGPDYRTDCYAAYHLKWQPPAKGRAWFRQFCRAPCQVRPVRPVVPYMELLEARGEHFISKLNFNPQNGQMQTI